MLILHLADLHFDLEHYAWLETQASQYDLVVIAGDLLERFQSETPHAMQRQLVLASLRRIAQKCKWLAVCTGNHDVVSSAGEWLNELKQYPNCILDYQIKLTDAERPVLITCCPWAEPHDLRGEYRLEKLLMDAAAIRAKHNALWLIVHHSPPGFGPESEPLLRTIKLEKPDFVFSGHDHRTPFVSKQPFMKMGSTLCLNPGRPTELRRRPEPPVLIVDTDKNTLAWEWGGATSLPSG